MFAGSFGLDQAAAVCSDGDQAAALDVIDRLAGKSMLTVEMAATGTRYRMLETIRQYAAGRLTEADGTEATRRRHAYAFLTLAEREHAVAVLSRDHDNFRAALDWSLRTGDEAGPRLARALGGFWLARGFSREARDGLERALASGPADEQVRADLLRLLGTVLFEAGDLAQAQAVLSEGCAVAQAAGLPAAVQARIRLNLTEIRFLEGGGSPSLTETLTECQAALATLEIDGDLEGMAEAWLTIGQLHSNLGDPTCEEAFERAIDCARRSGHHRAELKASRWLVFSFTLIPIRVDIAIGRAEQLLETHSGDAWAEAMIGAPLSTLYAYAGRFTDARAAITRAQAVALRSGARLDQAVSTFFMGEVDTMAGDPAAAEAKVRQGCETLRAIGERGYLASGLPVLAEAVYAQGRLGEADQLTREAEALAAADDLDAQVRWRVTRAKVLARRGHFAAARQLASEAEALIAPTPFVIPQAEVLEVKAEVAKLAGEPEEAVGYLRRRCTFMRNSGRQLSPTGPGPRSPASPPIPSDRFTGRCSTGLQPPCNLPRRAWGHEQRSRGGRHEPHPPHLPIHRHRGRARPGPADIGHAVPRGQRDHCAGTRRAGRASERGTPGADHRRRRHAGLADHPHRCRGRDRRRRCGSAPGPGPRRAAARGRAELTGTNS